MEVASIDQELRITDQFQHNPYKPYPPCPICSAGCLQCEQEKATYNIQQCTNLYVSNLPNKADEHWLRAEFSPFGLITSARVKVERGKSKGYGFVQYVEASSALSAVSAMNGRCINGRRLNVRLADRDKDRGMASPPSNNIYVSNLPLSYGPEELAALLGALGPILSLVVLSDPYTGKSRGVGLVRFYTVEDSTTAIQLLNGVVLCGHDRPLEVKYAESQEEKQVRRLHKVGNSARSRSSNSSDYKNENVTEKIGDENITPADSLLSDVTADSTEFSNDLCPWDVAAQMVAKKGTLPKLTLPPPEKDTVLYVGGLPSGFGEMLLYKLFSPFGAVISAKVIVDPQTQASRNYGFVQFRAHSDAKEAVKQLNGLVLGKKTLQISFHNRSSDIWQSSFAPLAPPSP